MSDFVPLKTRSTRDRSIRRSLQRWVSTKSSISQLSFFLFFLIYVPGTSVLLVQKKMMLITCTVRRGGDQGRKSWNLLAIKTQGKNPGGEGGEEPAMWPRIWVTTTVGGREKKSEDNKWDGGKKQTVICTLLLLVPSLAPGPSPQSHAKQATSCPTSWRHANWPNYVMWYGTTDRSLVDKRPEREMRDARFFWVRHREMLAFVQAPKRYQNGVTFRVHSGSHLMFKLPYIYDRLILG